MSAACALSLASSLASAAPPGLWFWGGGGTQSLADIAAFQKATGAAAPTIYYSMGGFSMAGGKFAGSMNASKIKQMAPIKVQATLGTSSIKDLRCAVQASVSTAVHTPHILSPGPV